MQNANNNLNYSIIVRCKVTFWYNIKWCCEIGFDSIGSQSSVRVLSLVFIPFWPSSKRIVTGIVSRNCTIQMDNQFVVLIPELVRKAKTSWKMWIKKRDFKLDDWILIKLIPKHPDHLAKLLTN